MNECPIIQDLLPLYVDDALQPESRALVDEHLRHCSACRQSLRSLQVGGLMLSGALPENASPSEDARFLTRLKRRVGTVIGLGMTALLLTALLAGQYGRWQADREYGRRFAAEQQEEKAALEAIHQATPDPLARLRERGVAITALASHQGDSLKVDYRLEAPAAQVIPLSMGRSPSPRLLDPSTGQQVGRSSESGSSTGPYGPTEGFTLFRGVTATPAHVQFQLPHLAVYLKPEAEHRWDLQRPAEEADLRVGQRFTVAGVEFEVERVRFTRDQLQIDYRQVTDPARVGLYFLTFRVSDRMGSTWGGDYALDRLPDPVRPSQRFDFVPSLSQNWSVQVEYAVLTVPGPTIPLEVK